MMIKELTCNSTTEPFHRKVTLVEFANEVLWALPLLMDSLNGHTWIFTSYSVDGPTMSFSPFKVGNCTIYQSHPVRVLCGLMLNSRKTSSSEMSSRCEIIISWRQLLGRFCAARPMTIITYHAIVSNNLVLLPDTFLVTWCSPPELVRAKPRF